MPNLDGVELCRTIRHADFPFYIYFILLTSHSQLKYTLQGLEAGADDFITKPFNMEELILRVNVGRRTIALDTRDLAIFAMGKLTETRDYETGTHLARMRSYCRALASWLRRQQRAGYEINEDFVNLIYKTSPLHDIGKIAIPDCILLKPDKLDEGEFSIMKMHTVLGARMLGTALREYPNAEFLQMARDVALSHHEWYDGCGYPQGLAGDAIPLCGRIVALADVYDALTTKRVYKNAFSHTLAKSMIVEKSNSHFDPVIVEAFLAEESLFLAIRAEFADDNANDPTEYAAAIYNQPQEMDS
jgi:putative two-component system response regulator